MSLPYLVNLWSVSCTLMVASVDSTEMTDLQIVDAIEHMLNVTPEEGIGAAALLLRRTELEVKSHFYLCYYGVDTVEVWPASLYQHDSVW